MLRTYSILIWVFGLAMISACTRNPYSGASKLFQIPISDAHGQYSLQTVELSTLGDPRTMEGAAAQIKVNPVVTTEGLDGQMPAARFILSSDGVMIPMDYVSMQLTTVYYHVEKLWELEKSIHLENVLARPRKLGLSVGLIDPGDDRKIVNNALFYAPLDVTLLVPYERSNIPISMNGGILAHEHFHALFSELMGPKIANLRSSSLWEKAPVEILDLTNDVDIPEKLTGPVKIRKYNAVLLRALDEGLADFWGWVYTGDDSFVAASLPELEMRRSLFKLSDSDKIKQPPSREAILLRLKKLDWDGRTSKDLSYLIGTFYARFLRNIPVLMDSTPFSKGLIFSDSNVTHRLKLAEKLIQALPRLRDSILESYKKAEPINPNDLFFSIFPEVERKSWSKNVCERLKAFLVEDDLPDVEVKVTSPDPAAPPQLIATKLDICAEKK